jgi:large subunit ribosomal protein L30
MTLKALGLAKVNQEVVKEDNEAIRGMIETVKHLVEVKE